MPSYWERRAQESRQRSLAAQASRYSGQASQFDNVSRQVGEATGYGGVSSVLEARARRRREEEAERVRRQNALRLAEEERRRAEEVAARRAQAEARVAEARRRREAEDAASRPRFALPTGALGPGFQPTAQDYAQAGSMALGVGEEVAFGPERQSVFGGQATRGERTLRDWGLSEQEFRASGSAFDEGRPLAGLGWGALAVAGAVPLFGQAGRGLVKGAGAVGDVVRAAGSAADVERVVGRVGDISADVSRAVVNNPNPVYTLPPEQLAKVPQGREVTAEVFHRQGFDRLPTAVDGNEFSRAASSGDYIALYRGIRGGKNPVRGSVEMADETVDAQRSAEDFIRGDMFYGGGAGPDGSYFATSLDAARGYAVGVNPMMASSEPGAVISALLPRTARIVRHDDPALLAEFSQSGYNNIGAFAAAKGYDAILHKEGIHIVLNRSALTVSDAPEIHRFGSETAESAADVGRAAENLRAATIARATPEQISSVSSVGPLPNRAKEAVTQQSRTLDSLRETQLSTMHRLTPNDLEELRRASPAVRQMSPDNIWVIHETSFPPSRSGNDTVLRPTADYVSETGRHSVHFSLNHSAAGHEFRQGAGSRYVVAARLSDVLEANPGSLDNLYSVDTFFTPRPGEGLRIPNATVLEDAQSVSTQQAIRNLIEESGGVAIAGGPRYSPVTGVDVRIRQLAEELNVPSLTHDGHPLFSFESNFLNGFGNADPNFYLPLMSDNARLRVSSENVWTHPRMDSRSRFRVPGDEDV